LLLLPQVSEHHTVERVPVFSTAFHFSPRPKKRSLLLIVQPR